MDEWLEIGTIIAAQGLKGEVRINPSSDFPERFERPGKRWLRSPDGINIREVELLQGRYLAGKNLYVLQLAGVQDRNDAEALRGYQLLVSSSDRPQLAKDEYHVSDLLDLEVYNQLTGERLGVVSDVYTAGNDLLEVKLDKQLVVEEDFNSPTQERKNGKVKTKKPKVKTILIPFVKEIVPIVNLQEKRIEILPPPGLLDLNNT
jgi:16S rRNA processing protein RimM